MVVFGIHHSNKVESVKIGSRKLAGTMVETIAVALTVAPHTAVGQLAYMPGADARRVYHKFVGTALKAHQTVHDAVGRRRTADVA
jgi:hypothetical protein